MRTINNKNNSLRKLFISKFKNMSADRQNLFLNYILKRKQKHKFHLVSPSPWPLYTAFSAFVLVIGLISWMHKIDSFLLVIGVLLIALSMYFWFRDIIREAVYIGYHTQKVQLNLRYGFLLFIVSEVMFFFGFFWALLHFSLCPSIFTGNIWPPEGIINFIISQDINTNIISDFYSNYFKKNFDNFFYSNSYNFNFINSTTYYPVEDSFFSNLLNNDNNLTLEKSTFNFNHYNFYRSLHYFKNDVSNLETSIYINLYSPGVLVNPLSIPLLNTVILLSSGVFLTYSHISLKLQKFFRSILALGFTVLFGIYFFLCQIFEYSHSGFSINDGVYGSTFYMLTGFHGFHVFVGTVFLIVCFFRFLLQHFTPTNHFGFEAAIWYWHFVDVVWILLFFLVYYWPNIFYFKDSYYTFNDLDNLICVNKSLLDLSDYNLKNEVVKYNGSTKNILNLVSLILIDSKDDYFSSLNKFNSNKEEFDSLFNIKNYQNYLKNFKN